MSSVASVVERSTVYVAACILFMWTTTRLYKSDQLKRTVTERRAFRINARLRQLKTEPRYACPQFRWQSFAWAMVGHPDLHHPDPERKCPDLHNHDYRFGYQKTEAAIEYTQATGVWNQKLWSTYEAKVSKVSSSSLHAGDIVLWASRDYQPLLYPVHWAIYTGNGQFLSKMGGHAPSTDSQEVLYTEYVKYGALPILWRIDLT